MSCGVDCSRGSNPALLWLWHRPVATVPIRPLAWEPPYAVAAAQEIAKGTKKNCNYVASDVDMCIQKSGAINAHFHHVY